MHRSRLLLVVPAATALVLTGIAPAAADGGGGHDNGNDAWAEILEIDDEAELSDDGDELDVTFEYKCEADGEDVTADVTAENGATYTKDDVDLDCDGDKHSITVTLEKENDDEFEKGDRVEVTVTISADDDELDKKSEWVEVVDDDDGDHDDNGDEDHHHDDGH